MPNHGESLMTELSTVVAALPWMTNIGTRHKVVSLLDEEASCASLDTEGPLGRTCQGFGQF